MRTLKRFAIVPMVVLVFQGLALAEEIRGVINKVDADKKELVVEVRNIGKRGLPMTFKITDDSKILLNRKSGALSDLSPGARVRVLYETQGGQRVALGITVRGGDNRAEPVADANTLTGTIQRIIFTEREIVVTSPGPQGKDPVETTVFIPEKAKITRMDTTIKLDDLKEGERVVVRTEKQDGKPVTAVSIQVGEQAKTPTGPDRIQQLRLALKIADFLLQQMSKQQNAPKP
jgi:Cu/Ag efflux protein CusF